VLAYVVDGVLHMMSGSAQLGKARLGSGQFWGMGGLHGEGSTSGTDGQKGGHVWWCRLVLDWFLWGFDSSGACSSRESISISI